MLRAFWAGCLLSFVLVACGGGNDGSNPTPAPGPTPQPPSGLSYSGATTVSVGVLVTLTPTVAGEATTWAVSPALPAGISIDPATGVIDGSPRVSLDATTYTVTASNDAGSSSAEIVLTVRTSMAVPVPYSYSPFFKDDPTFPYSGQNINLYAWEGPNVVILSRVIDLNPGLMELWLGTLDAAWDFYVASTGRSPNLGHAYNNKVTIADVPRTCGAGCGQIGFTGIEADSIFFDREYNSALENGAFGGFLMYEMGRNFWFYSPQVAYKAPDNSSSVVTGFAVLMQWWSMEAAGARVNGDTCFPSGHEEALAHMEGLVDQYVNDTSLNWSNTLLEDRGVGTGCATGGADLFASFLMRLRRDHGGPDFHVGLWQEADIRPDATTTQEAVDNLVLAACAAADKNLTALFNTTWRWPVSDAAKQEAQLRFGNP